MTGATARLTTATGDIGLWLLQILLWFCLGAMVEYAGQKENNIQESAKSSAGFPLLLFAVAIFFHIFAGGSSYSAEAAAFLIGALNAHSVNFHGSAAAPVTSAWSSASNQLASFLLYLLSNNKPSEPTLDSSAWVQLPSWVTGFFLGKGLLLTEPVFVLVIIAVFHGATVWIIWLLADALHQAAIPTVKTSPEGKYDTSEHPAETTADEKTSKDSDQRNNNDRDRPFWVIATFSTAILLAAGALNIRDFKLYFDNGLMIGALIIAIVMSLRLKNGKQWTAAGLVVATSIFLLVGLNIPIPWASGLGNSSVPENKYSDFFELYNMQRIYHIEPVIVTAEKEFKCEGRDEKYAKFACVTLSGALAFCDSINQYIARPRGESELCEWVREPRSVSDLQAPSKISIIIKWINGDADTRSKPITYRIACPHSTSSGDKVDDNQRATFRCEPKKG